MPTCGGLRIGVLISEPKTPPLVIVNVPPLRSSSVSVPFCALPAKSRMPCSMPANERSIGVAQHRHDQPPCGADGDADVVVVLETISSPWISALRRGNALSAPTAALTKNEAMPRPTP